MKIIASAIGISILAWMCAAQPAAPVEKTAGQAWKNVLVLKDVPASQWGATMDLIGGSLGVGCQFCHAQAYESDAKKTKVTARAMIQMTQEINARSFGGHTVVTCNTCHQGGTHPKSIPALWNKTPEELAVYKKEQELVAERAKAPATEKSAESLPDLERVLANYRKAVGDSAVKSIHMVATMAPDRGSPRDVEVSVVFPDKLAIALLSSGVQAKTVLNGDRGWNVTPQGKVDVPPERIPQMKQNITFFAPIKFASSDGPRKVTGIEQAAGRTNFIVESDTPKKLERLYFDTQTGLLHKVHTEIRTVLGPSVNELVFEDYRDVSGVKLPFSMKLFTYSDRVVYTFSEMQTNAGVELAKFEPPPATK
ncbi:MAG TPA: photosynthetic reaction center cytochrome c subunit family protein [Bryobacteraceae bacterium]|nr:photosynthetic reaction center cytochrome c subunit family protein [Bryobacteraceae bacterium]